MARRPPPAAPPPDRFQGARSCPAGAVVKRQDLAGQLGIPRAQATDRLSRLEPVSDLTLEYQHLFIQFIEAAAPLDDHCVQCGGGLLGNFDLDGHLREHPTVR